MKNKTFYRVEKQKIEPKCFDLPSPSGGFTSGASQTIVPATPNKLLIYIWSGIESKCAGTRK